MTYVVTDACIKCKYMDCVEVCPVDCFYEGEVMLVINTNECSIAAFASGCPVRRSFPHRERAEKWLEVNAEWPNITRKRTARPTPTSIRAKTASSKILWPTPAKGTDFPRRRPFYGRTENERTLCKLRPHHVERISLPP
jgi:ferredoxin